jgi:hypothetical protein
VPAATTAPGQQERGRAEGRRHSTCIITQPHKPATSLRTSTPTTCSPTHFPLQKQFARFHQRIRHMQQQWSVLPALPCVHRSALAVTHLHKGFVAPGVAELAVLPAFINRQQRDVVTLRLVKLCFLLVCLRLLLFGPARQAGERAQSAEKGRALRGMKSCVAAQRSIQPIDGASDQHRARQQYQPQPWQHCLTLAHR